jgi:hypothetical protein
MQTDHRQACKPLQMAGHYERLSNGLRAGARHEIWLIARYSPVRSSVPLAVAVRRAVSRAGQVSRVLFFNKLIIIRSAKKSHQSSSASPRLASSLASRPTGATLALSAPAIQRAERPGQRRLPTPPPKPSSLLHPIRHPLLQSSPVSAFKTLFTRTADHLSQAHLHIMRLSRLGDKGAHRSTPRLAPQTRRPCSMHSLPFKAQCHNHGRSPSSPGPADLADGSRHHHA